MDTFNLMLRKFNVAEGLIYRSTGEKGEGNNDAI